MNVTRLALVALMILIVGLAVAADPEPQAPAEPPTRGEQATVTPALDINRAEIEAGVVNDAVEAAKAAGAELSPMMAEIQATMQASRAEVADLAARAVAAPDAETRQALQGQITQLKRQAELDVLAIQARHARTAGNEELASQIEAAIASIESPAAPTAPAEPRPAPVRQ